MLDALIDWFFGLLYKAQAGICYLIDFIKRIFYKLCGLDTVVANGKDVDLVSYLVQSNTIHRVFLTIFLIGVILLTIFLIVALIRVNYQASDRKTRGVIFSKAAQSVLIMLIIPFLLLAGMTLVNTIMASINISMQQYITSGQTLIGGQMLITTGSDAFIGSEAERVAIETKFLTGELDYNKLGVVKQYYDISEINFVVGLLGGLVMLVMFVISSVSFIQRIFDIILLYIISPVSASTIPLDDGNRFRVWKDMIISKLLGAYGIILVMNLFFLIMPQVNRMTFFDNNVQNGLVYILFLIGGAFAVTKANLVISQLTGSQAGGRELAQMIYNLRSGIAFARAAKGAVGAVVGGAIGGSDYLKNRKQGHSNGESLNMSAHSMRNQQIQVDNKSKSKAKKIAGAPIRLATMPIGVMKDLMQGGVIQAGKNFFPRLRNVVKGDTFTNKAVIKGKVNADATDKHISSNLTEKANNMTNETTKPTSKAMGEDVSDAVVAASDNDDKSNIPKMDGENSENNSEEHKD